MGRRLDLHTLLTDILGAENVYFQPPPNKDIIYPAIVYNQDFQNARFGDNIPYSRTKRWQITIIDRDPDSLIPDKVGDLPMTTFVRHFTTEGLNHNVYDAYF